MKIGPIEVVAYFAGGAVVSIASLVLAHLVAGDAEAKTWLGQNGAAWVQAVGSVAAIVFGFWYPEHRRRNDTRERRANSRRTLVTVAGDMVNYLTRERNLADKNPVRAPMVDDIAQQAWWFDLRSVDVANLDRLDRGRWWTLRHHLLTIGNRMSQPVLNPMKVSEMSEMSQHIWDNVLRPMSDAGAWEE